MPTRFTEQSQRFRPNSNEDQVLQKAREHFEATLIGVQGELAGSVAAMEHRRADDALNYGEIFLRDNVPVMIYLMLEGRFAIVKQPFRSSGGGPIATAEVVVLWFCLAREPRGERASRSA